MRTHAHMQGYCACKHWKEKDSPHKPTCRDTPHVCCDKNKNRLTHAYKQTTSFAKAFSQSAQDERTWLLSHAMYAPLAFNNEQECEEETPSMGNVCSCGYM